MTNPILRFLTALVGAGVYIVYVLPFLYSLLNPFGFWQNFVMLMVVDTISAVLTVGVIAGFLNDMFDSLFN